MSSPILLLKTKSTPHDGYDEFFSAHNYTPLFIPVLEHQIHPSNLALVRSLFESGGFNPSPARKYGGLIFTSQRAVEAFASLLNDIPESITAPASQSLILYTVGPATARSLATLRDAHLPQATIYGTEAGTGENLAGLILDHYNGFFNGRNNRGDKDDSSNTAGAAPVTDPNNSTESRGCDNKPPLLFLVGEQRRDVIPKTLLGAPGDRRIVVDELVVYQTGVVEGFERDFANAVSRQWRAGAGVLWVVVFSPTGCDAMLRVLDDERRKRKDAGKVLVATIGPTTRDHLVNNYGVEPEVCAREPTPEGVGSGIEEYMSMSN